MTRPLSARRPTATPVLALCLAFLPGLALGQQREREGNIGQFFAIDQPINSDSIERLQAGALALVNREARQGQEPILFFELRPGTSSFGAANDLASFLSTKLAGAKETVAYIPEPVSGYGILTALACGEIILGPKATLGPIVPAGQAADPSQREFIRHLAQRRGRGDLADLFLGMLDPDADLQHVQTADGRWHYVMPERLAQLPGVVKSEPAWSAGRRGVLDADRAREVLARLIASDRGEVARAYGVANLADDPTLGQKINPVWIKIDGVLDSVKESYLRRRIAQARQERVNLLFFQFDTPGGLYEPADGIAEMIVGLRDIKTVAFVDDRAMGVATLPVLACDEIVFAKGGQMGQGNQILSGWSGPRAEPLDARLLQPAARRAAEIAKRKGHNEAIAAAMIDPDIILVEAKDANTGAPAIVTEETAKADPARFLDPSVRKPAGEALVLKSDDAAAFRVAREVVADADEFQAIYGLRGQAIRAEGANWVDGLVSLLNTPWMKGTLLFLGLFMLVLELKLPGIGLPAILSALAFLLFFWSSYLSGTADQLEIMLFLVGLICLALELFVFPGLGVFGMSGILLVLVSVVMASHTFVWPTHDYEYRQMGMTLIQVTLALVGVGTGIVLVGRFFPSIPLLNRMVLKPEIPDDDDPTAKPEIDAFPSSFYFLQGETGRSTTVLRPAGKARFGELLIDVIADGDYIEPDRLVEVIEVRGSTVVVKRV